MNVEFFINNRKRFAENMEDNSLAVFFSGVAPRESLDQDYHFIVDRNFYYFTGIQKDNMALVISKLSGVVTESLFIPPVDEYYEKWFGILMKSEEAIKVSGIKDIMDINNFDENIAARLSGCEIPENLYLALTNVKMTENHNLYRQLAIKVKEQFPAVNVLNAMTIVSELRTRKQQDEIEEIKTAIGYTKEALEFVMKNLKPGTYEYQLRANFEYQLMLRNSAPSFKTIAASGKNACILHYIDLQNKMQDGDLVLCDLGALSNMYASDITRTYPVNGKFTARQKEIYNIVLGAQEVALDVIKPGIEEIKVQEAVKNYYAKALKSIKLISDDSDVNKYYYHGIGHPLGLDVHDLRRRNKTVQENNVYTNEPGLYIAEYGIGIRIEDDIWVTKNGNINLSKDIIKTVEDIENFMK